MKNLFLGIIVATALFSVASDVHAQCTCVYGQESAYDELKRSNVVFVGEVTGIKKIESVKGPEHGEFDVTFKVKMPWKTDLPETITVRNISYGNEGKSDFIEKENYLVYGHVYDKVLSAHRGCCTRTSHISYAAEDLEEFKERGEKPTRVIKTPISRTEARPDNSLNPTRN